MLTIVSTGFSVYNAGKVLGVWMLTALVFQVVLASRIDFIEKGIGYDRLTNWHSLNGKSIALLILLHPLTMLVSPVSVPTSGHSPPMSCRTLPRSSVSSPWP
ncbi:MAG: ferric reductase-like transmembrane domain-containing protein [Candidatus Nanohaloarchaea archaeon]|nr:ferric reductase-like transmembrane domain-containing protein [Candidatus Nanohaloarchaea archaeon]